MIYDYVQPSEVAKVLVKDALCGKFFSYIGLESFMLTNMSAGNCRFAMYFNTVT